MNILSLLKELWPEKKPHELVNERIKIDKEKLLIIKHKGRLAGILSYKKILGTFYVSKLIITSAYRGLGLGTKLLNKAFKKAKKTSCWLLWLNTGRERKKSLRFYTHYGLSRIMIFTIIFYKIIK